MTQLAEDVYYVTRDTQDVIGLNQLVEVPRALSRVELEAVLAMCDRSETTMKRQTTAQPHDNLGPRVPRAPGLYYVGPDGMAWPLSIQDTRPDLSGIQMDFAVATLRAGEANLRTLRSQLELGA